MRPSCLQAYNLHTSQQFLFRSPSVKLPFNTFFLDIFTLRPKTESLPEINLNRGIASQVFLPKGAYLFQNGAYMRTSRKRESRIAPSGHTQVQFDSESTAILLQLYIYEGSLVETGVYITLINIFGHMYLRLFLLFPLLLGRST